jgi:hypothetical protein
VDATYLDPIADVVAAAKAACERRFPALAKPTLRVDVRPALGWYESTVTDRQDTIYVHLGRKGLGEYMRGDAGPVGILCQAVAELHNPRRLPGLDRFVAHRYLVPAAVAEVGPGVLPVANATPMASDGPPMLDLLTDDAYASVHPDFAAAKALAAIDDATQPEGLASLLAGIPADADDPFAALRRAAVAKAAQLADAFQTYDEATRIELQPDGKVLVASFEANEIVSGVVSHPLSALHDPLVAVVSREFQMSQTDEWAADGALSLKLYAEQPRAYINWEIADPDWRLKDWRPYSAFEMDLRLDGIEPQKMSVRAYDEVGLGHGVLYLWAGAMQPGEERHLRCNLADANRRAAKSPQADYFGGTFRDSEVATVIVILYEPTQPFTLYVDNLRLTPRTVAVAPR